MKKLSIILFLCVSVCNFIFASAAHPGPYLRVQPNGDSIYVYWRADEYSGYYTDLKKNVIAENEEGYWVYVKIKRGKWFLTNQVVSKTSTPKKIDKEAVMDYIAEASEKARRRRHGGLPEFTIKNERVKKWMNPKIECFNIKDSIYNLNWLIDKTNFGEYDFSCLLLYKNDSTNEYYFVNHYIDISKRYTEHNITNVITVVDIYEFDGRYFIGGAILINKNYDFYNQINIAQNNTQLREYIGKINKLFNKKYNQTDKLIKLAYKRKKEYKQVTCFSCEIISEALGKINCEEFLNTHTLVDVIGYSYIKYPINVGNKMK
jgi:hypothetical protein